MTTAVMERQASIASAPTVTAEQLELVRKTVAAGATPDELKLYLYDCARQGVHPLDKLIHFTKRSGKYTPITSIDFMRIRAADSGEYAGSDDAVFHFSRLEGAVQRVDLEAATVTVYRLVQGQRCSFTATARWAEYKPDANDFMWKKMPHTMLAKCAEALALRKGFPRQLAGLYAAEEMDQANGHQGPSQAQAPTPMEERGRAASADSGSDRQRATETTRRTQGAIAPAKPILSDSPAGVSSTAVGSVIGASAPNAGDSGASIIDTTTGEERPAPPPGYHYLTGYVFKNGWHEVTVLGLRIEGHQSHDARLSTKKEIGFLAEQASAAGFPVKVTTKPKRAGGKDGEAYLDSIMAWKAPLEHEPTGADGPRPGMFPDSSF